MHLLSRHSPSWFALTATPAFVTALLLNGPYARAQVSPSVVQSTVTDSTAQDDIQQAAEAKTITDIQKTLGSDLTGQSDTVTEGKQTVPLYFGQNYLRVIVQDVYLPSRRGRTPSLSITVRIKNKTSDDSQTGNNGLAFKYAIESKPGAVYSQRGQYTITPYFAVNSKCPIDITLEERETNKTATSAVSIVQGLLTGAANVFTGGAASTISTLTRYANASSALVGAYENTTTVTDTNHLVAFDSALDDKADLAPVRIALFTHGEEAFGVVDKNGEPHKFKESTAFNFAKATGHEEAEKFKSAYRFSLLDNIGRPTSERYYPDGKHAFVVLRFEVYNPHPNIQFSPEQIAGAGDSFRAMNALYLAHNAVSDKEKLKTLLAEEGAKLAVNLRTLTDAGDLSLKDARVLMDVYAGRVQSLSNLEKNAPEVIALHNIARTFYMPSNISSAERADLTDLIPSAVVAGAGVTH